MATERNGYNGQIFEALRNRFPEIPEQFISQTLQTEHGNTERCLRILAAESDRFLYGGGIDMLDSPMPVQPSSQNTPIDEPISITIPPTTTSPYLPNRTAPPPPLQPMIRPMTVAQPSPGMGYVSSGREKDHRLLQLDVMIKDMYNEHRKLIRLRSELQEKEMEMVNKKFRVAANPTSTDVKHLRDENHVLREEIDGMSREIDELSNGRDVVIGHPSNNPAILQQPPAYQPPPGMCMSNPQVRRAESYPSGRPHSGANGPVSSLQRFCSMFGSITAPPPHGEESPTSPPPDGSLTNEWVFLPPHLQNIVHTSEEPTWTCSVCTFANHEALEVCEMCDMARNRALEARA
ncbi:TGF-beta activated kinase 1 MAP3K7 binding protein 3 [Desmophyllum pertusum]|uniref:TGF-beta activated kinase 1 MAP3K7 binding protein 3 n=1 Tax=Desmophyllum pertusum TaxID=174260 RepID=A0A9X0A6S4_9CNID|nr:TGF-beta activated kinase 1 MAP3K7 binding protein 3 [Desmophyllum pertusum]